MANFNLNEVIMGGRLTADPKLSTTPSGTQVATFDIACGRKSKDGGTDFFRCVAWRQSAEFVCRYFTKGSSICVIGSIHNKEYTDKNGVKHRSDEIIVDEALFVDSKNDATTEARVEMNETIKGAPVLEEIKDGEELPF